MKKPAPMSDDELLRILKEEETNASSFYNSEMAKDQAGAMDRYHARPYGDEVAGRSSVVTHDLEDTINWIMPDLMRVFMGSDQIVSIDGATEEDESSGRTQDAADYLELQFRRDNDGDTILHDFAFDGMLQRIGVISVAWQDPKPKAPKELEGVTPEQLMKYTMDPEYKILAQAEDPETGTFKLRVRQTPRMGRVHLEGVPPEEFAWNKTSKSLETSTYHRRKRMQYLSELEELYPELKARMAAGNGVSKQDEEIANDSRFIARFSDERSTSTETSSMNESGARRQVALIEEYVRLDYDGDGIVELRAIKRVGDVICENIEVDESEFVDWTAIRVAHRMAGRSMDDVLKDIQKIRTVILRRALDGLAQSLTSRKVVNTKIVTEESIGDLLDNDIGGIVRADGDAGQAVAELSTPDTSGSALSMMEYMDQRGEEASGVNRQSQGMDPQAMNKTASGIDLLQAAAKVRTELIARWLAKGMEKVFKRMLQLTVAHQDGPRQVKIKGKFVSIDPRSWSDEMGVTVHVAMAAASRAAQVANLGIIASKQEQILMQAPNNPVVTLVHYRRTLAKLSEAMGFKDSTAFFAEIPEDWQPPQQEAPQDPKLIAVQAQIAADQAKAQSDQQAQAAEFQHKQAMAAADQQSAAQLAMMKMENEKELAMMKIQAETQAAADRTVAEMALARWKAEQELMLAREQSQQDAQLAREGHVMQAATARHAATTKPKNIGGGVRMGGAIG